MSDACTRAVFLSYASQDAEAVQRISDALCVAGIEVWFDQTGLAGGDAWDTEIRRRIRECALFVPVISANTQQRPEGYFRLEWRLAEQRTHQIVRGKPFLVPVVIDGTAEDNALVPEGFVDVQWTRIIDGDGAAAFAGRVKGLLTQAAVPAGAPGHEHLTSASTPPSQRAHLEAQPLQRRSVARAGLAIPAVLLLIGSVLLWMYRSAGSQRDQPAAANAATVTQSAPRTAVAVLPFANLTGDASKDYLGDGMAEELINTLAKVRGLKVPARTSTFAYKGRNTDVRQIAKDLGVGSILEGSVRAAGRRIRITAQLINAQDGLHLWSESYDEEFTDIFKLQDKLATQIAKALQPSLGGAAEATIAQGPPTQDVEAYNLYLQGLTLTDRPNEANLQQAIASFQRAIDRDPKFARAHDGMANANLIQYRLGSGSERLVDAERSARRALALDPGLASARSVLASVANWRGQLLDMEVHGRAALALAADDAWVHINRAIGLINTGHLREMLEEGRKAYSLAPASAQVVANLALFSIAVGRDAEGLKLANLAVTLGYPKGNAPLHAVYGYLALRAGRFTEVADRFASTQTSGSSPSAELLRLTIESIADRSRRPAAAQARMRLFADTGNGSSTEGGSGCLIAAFWYAQTEDLDGAYELANRCVDRLLPGASRVLFALWTPEVRAFRMDPRFQPLATRLGLMDYWEQYGPPDDCELKEGRLICR